jgi:surface antigen
MPVARRSRYSVRRRFIASCIMVAVAGLGGSVSTAGVAGASPSDPPVAESPQTNSYAYGYGTWYVAMRRSVPPNWGNARNWYYLAQANGYAVGSKPVPGAIAWTDRGIFGNVAYVEGVSGDLVTVSEMNYDGGWNRVTVRTVPAGSFLYIY